VCNRFFYRYRQETARIGDIARRKEEERNRNVIADFTEEYARELRSKRFIEEQEKIENCYRDGELRRRISKAQIDIWYLPALATNDITKYQKVRMSLFVDALKALEILINTST
jgi:hypothetical protein